MRLRRIGRGLFVLVLAIASLVAIVPIMLGEAVLSLLLFPSQFSLRPYVAGFAIVSGLERLRKWASGR